jgi:predicted HD phosphohydrolase
VELSHALAQGPNLQGRPASAEEIMAFEIGPFFKAIVALRRFDNAGTQPYRRAADLANPSPMLESLLVSGAG